MRFAVAVAVLSLSGSPVAATATAQHGLPETEAVRAGGQAPCTIDYDLLLGTESGDVACLEHALVALGYTVSGGPDAFYGVTTARAVMDFQRSHALAADGIFGPRSRAALVEILGRPAPVPPAIIERRVIGISVEGRDIVAERMGTPGGRVVLVIGIIHGDEQKGAEITRLLRTLPTPAGIDLWLIDSMNPDGQAASTRENANRVDLNRNFETGWSYIPMSTEHRQYSGEAPADQPETIAVEAFIHEIKPAIGIWYHQDANSISTSGANKLIPTTYGQLVGLSPANVPCSQRCTGTAGTFANATVPGSTNFLVELPASNLVTADMIRTHAEAVLAVSVL